jgi:hypothetical protein
VGPSAPHMFLPFIPQSRPPPLRQATGSLLRGFLAGVFGRGSVAGAGFPNISKRPFGFHPELRNRASGPEIGLPGQIWAGFKSVKLQSRPSGWPSADRRTDFEAFPTRIRNPARKPDLWPGSTTWLCLKWFLFWVLGPDCHFPKDIVGFGSIPARIRTFLIFILALSAARTIA